MLVQLVALLSLGALCSSAPMQVTRPTAAKTLSPEEERSRALGVLIIQEILQDMKKLNLKAVPSLITVNAPVGRCTRSHLKTFSDTLETLDILGKIIARKLKKIDSLESILPEDLDEECPTVEVTGDMFRETLESFLRLLSEKIQAT